MFPQGILSLVAELRRLEQVIMVISLWGLLLLLTGLSVVLLFRLLLLLLLMGMMNDKCKVLNDEGGVMMKMVIRGKKKRG